MPLDTFVPDPAHCMQVVDDPEAVPETVKDFQKIINEVRRLYGNIILKKGVIK